MLKNYVVIDSNCDIGFISIIVIDNIDTIDIFNKHKVLTKYCTYHHTTIEKNWCRLTIYNQTFRKKSLWGIIMAISGKEKILRWWES